MILSLFTSKNYSKKHAQIRYVLFLILFVILCVLPLRSVSFREDISAMIPAGTDGRIKEDFTLLQKAPLSGSVLITLQSKKVTPEQLINVAKSLSSRFKPPYFILQDYSKTTPQSIIDYLLTQAPNLTTEADLKNLEELTSPNTVAATLKRNKHQLISPIGIGVKKIIVSDPLNLRSLYLKKIASLRFLPHFNTKGQHILNNDQTALLLIAKSQIPMTDSNGGEKLLSNFKQISHSALAENNLKSSDISISLLSGHIYTVANASIIKHDLTTISIVSAVALIILFLFSFRHVGALAIFLAPGIAIMAGLGSTAIFFPNMSTIVIGFGSILMGVSIDFAIHTYFALADRPDDPKQAVRNIKFPILYGAATSCVAFGALYISGIPGIKQLAVFSVVGIIAACSYALLFIPNFCCSFPSISQNTPPRLESKKRGSKKITLIISAILIISGSIIALSNCFDTELKHLGYISENIHNTEKIFTDSWGDLRGHSLLFASGSTQQEALQKNAKVWADITKNLQNEKAINISQVLPDYQAQQDNFSRWRKFWNNNKINETKAILQKEGAKLHFAPKIFDSSIKKLSNPIVPESIQSMRSSSLGFLAEMLIPKTSYQEHVNIITLLPDTERIIKYYTPQKETLLGVRLVAQSKFKQALEFEMEKDILRFIGLSGVLVIILILLLFKNIRRATLAIFPAIFGVISTFSLLSILNIPLNIFHIIALPLVIGLGADYGIFMVFQEVKEATPSTLKAVRISGLTTLAGFGVLVLAKHPSLNSLGATVAIGISSALLCAIFILPRLLNLHYTTNQSKEA